MSHNPYSPPAAEVADPAHALPPQPGTVRLAVQLIIGALALGVISLLVPGIRIPTPEEAEVPFIFTMIIIVIFGGITLWFASGVTQGKNWARWAMLAWLAVGWLMVGSEFGDEFTRSPVSSMIDAACIAMEAAACCLLFGAASQDWFAAMAVARRR
jgi:hypothetical protein